MTENWMDDAILSMLPEAIWGEPPVPVEVREAAYAAFSWRTIDGELAALTYDSTTEELATSGARSQQAGLRAMTFATSAVTIELEVVSDVLLGQLVPPLPVTVELRPHSGRHTTILVDSLGCFTIDPIPTGRFRLQLQGPTTVTTDWISL